MSLSNSYIDEIFKALCEKIKSLENEIELLKKEEKKKNDETLNMWSIANGGLIEAAEIIANLIDWRDLKAELKKRKKEAMEVEAEDVRNDRLKSFEKLIRELGTYHVELGIDPEDLEDI